MISISSISKRDIQFHYDLSTFFYRLFWGPHIHHGLWDTEESPEAAQINLTNVLAHLADIRRGHRVLDVGCGMGGSSIHLAKTLGACVTGITLSPVQRRWAVMSAWWQGVGKATQFHRIDAEAAEFAPASFDVIWSVECTEHLFDKPAFFQRAARWLRPGGAMAICAWLAGENSSTAEGTRQVERVCEGFLCPSLGTTHDYEEWMRKAGLVLETQVDWTDRVLETWEICRRRVDRARVRWLARAIDRQTVQFLNDFSTILEAYRSRAMGYGCFVARKPTDS